MDPPKKIVRCAAQGRGAGPPAPPSPALNLGRLGARSVRELHSLFLSIFLAYFSVRFFKMNFFSNEWMLFHQILEFGKRSIRVGMRPSTPRVKVRKCAELRKNMQLSYCKSDQHIKLFL